MYKVSHVTGFCVVRSCKTRMRPTGCHSTYQKPEGARAHSTRTELPHEDRYHTWTSSCLSRGPSHKFPHTCDLNAKAVKVCHTQRDSVAHIASLKLSRKMPTKAL